MSWHRIWFWVIFCLTGVTFFGVAARRYSAPAASQQSPRNARLVDRLGKLPAYFIENRGQSDPAVAYYVLGRDTSVFFTKTSVVYSLRKLAATPAGSARSNVFRPASLRSETSSQNWAVKLDLIGANPDLQIEGVKRTEAIVSSFTGPRDQWTTAAPTYSGIIYRDVWPGIDMKYDGAAGNLKYTFIVHPGADPSQIRLAYRGAQSLKLTPDGRLAIDTPAGGFTDEKPVAWQDAPKSKPPVDVAFRLNGQQFDFKIGVYDKSKDLVLDPVVLVYVGFIGGTTPNPADNVDQAIGVAVDAAGNAYVAGFTNANQSSFPVTVGPDLTYNGGTDAFVAKVNPAGTALVYAGFIGGAKDDSARAIAVDFAGNAYVTGYTNSDQSSFPVAVGPDLTYNGDPGDAFVAKINPAGTALIYCGYIGGAANEGPNSIALDLAGNAYVAGFTESNQSTFPVIGGPDLTQNGGKDAFIAKVNPSGSALVYSGYIGGSGDETAGGVVVDAAGAAYVVGSTSSSQSTFPVIVGPDLTYNGGVGGDAFIAKVDPSGASLTYCGYVGGAGTDAAFGIAIDGSGAAYIAGATDSDQSSFPVRVGPDLTYNGGSSDGFVAKINPAGTATVYAGYIGGAGADSAGGIAVDLAGNAYVGGATNSSQTTFPVLNGPGLTYKASDDVFVAKVNGAGTALTYSGYIGGADMDSFFSLALDSATNVYLAGYTKSTESTFPVTIGPGLTAKGGQDAFIAKVGAFIGTAGPTVAFRNGFGAIENGTFPGTDLRNSGGLFASNPALAISPAGRAFFVARDTTQPTFGALYLNWVQPDGTFGGFQYAAGLFQGDPAITTVGETAWIAGRDRFGSIWARSFNPNGGFTPWVLLGGILGTDPSISACPDGSVYIAAKDNFAGVWTIRYDGTTWKAWKFVGGVTQGKPSVACGSDNAAYVATRDTFNVMWLARVFQEADVSWTSGSGVFQDDLRTVVDGALIHVVGLSSSVTWERVWQVGTGWQPFRQIGGVFRTMEPAIYGGNLFVVGQSPSGDLYWWSSISNQFTNLGNRNIAANSLLSAGSR